MEVTDSHAWDYQNDTEDDEEFVFWDNVIDKLYVYQITQFSK